MKETFTVWITKWALTSGVLKMTVEQSERFPQLVTESEGYANHFHGEGREWHRTEESAKAKAEEMRVKKIASLEKQLAKLKGMKP